MINPRPINANGPVPSFRFSGLFCLWRTKTPDCCGSLIVVAVWQRIHPADGKWYAFFLHQLLSAIRAFDDRRFLPIVHVGVFNLTTALLFSCQEEMTFLFNPSTASSFSSTYLWQTKRLSPIIFVSIKICHRLIITWTAFIVHTARKLAVLHHGWLFYTSLPNS